MPPSLEPEEPPEAFRRAVTGLREAEQGTRVTLREIAAPTRLAPYAFALSAEVIRDDLDLASGRFIVLHDPDGNEAWDGSTRIAAFVSADVDDDMGADPLLAEVGWSWLLDALDAHGARHHATGGTVTRTSSSRFGAMVEDPDTSEIELRCSWTPEDDDLTPHLQAFCDVVCAMAGLPPTQPNGVLTLPTAL